MTCSQRPRYPVPVFPKRFVQHIPLCVIVSLLLSLSSGCKSTRLGPVPSLREVQTRNTTELRDDYLCLRRTWRGSIFDMPPVGPLVKQWGKPTRRKGEIPWLFLPLLIRDDCFNWIWEFGYDRHINVLLTKTVISKKLVIGIWVNDGPSPELAEETRKLYEKGKISMEEHDRRLSGWLQKHIERANKPNGR